MQLGSFSSNFFEHIFKQGFEIKRNQRRESLQSIITGGIHGMHYIYTKVDKAKQKKQEQKSQQGKTGQLAVHTNINIHIHRVRNS